ncbi:S-layer homology domain-containing protein [Phormidium sp. FACHB-1136]|uniref:S-layer homology domain-containing protein n=1 Tax=Phormidium sp. FACHB-1136 TaxID=2692848 RepID=UPI0016866B9F|nr:S-layer homology domain-containing protein [Phormidium sp. FACHB-1136]MBD2427649.1 S-layer homology domain-containing protein [Phormidium sp. FACHB-1136]
MVQTMSKTLEVDPQRGIDQPSGRPHLPYRTLTAALVAAQGNALIKLAPGTYSAESGERFPLLIGDRVVIMGQETTQGDGIVITGGGAVPGDGAISAALVVEDQAQVRGVTIQNPQGVGVLVRSGVPLVRACRLSQCGQAGVQVMGMASPLILQVRGDQMAGVGLLLLEQAKGEIRDCTLQRCNMGIHILGAAAPLLTDNHCANNQTGMRVAGTASPVLRQNRLVQNQQWGLLVQERGQPDLGQPGEAANNTLRHNRQGDLRNDTGQTLVTVGNDLLPQALVGPVTLAPSQVPDPAAVPPLLLDRAETAPVIAPSAPPEPPAPPPVVSRFVDLQGHWAAAYIEALADRNLAKGFTDGTYRPNDIITRSQFAALVASCYGSRPFVRNTSEFLDVPRSFWAYRAIDMAQRQGFVSGYPDQTYRPSQPMTRVQAIVAVVNGLGLPDAPASALGRYADRAQIPSYAMSPLSAATQAGLIINYPDADQLRPQDPMTRAEVSVLIYQGLVALGHAPRLTGADPTPPPPPLVQGSFADIQSHWAQDFIQGLLNLDLVRGQSDGQFYPDQAMTRAQFAALVTAAFQPAPRLNAQPFSDVPAHHWAANAIQMACRGGFLAGFPDGTFAPNHAVLRLQVWLALVNGLALVNDHAVKLYVVNHYQDRGMIPGYALEAVALATQLGLVVNMPDLTQLNPHRAASRADIAAAVYQTLVYQRRIPPLDHPYIVRI